MNGDLSNYVLALEAERDALKADLKKWRDYWGCESPHDSFVQIVAHGYARQLGCEQARANTAENEREALRKALEEITKTETPCTHRDGRQCIDIARAALGTLH